MNVLDHLWQSTLVAMAIAGLVFFFRNNSAGVRYGLWFAASVKFLLPFSLLTEIGRLTFSHPVAPGSLALLARVEPATTPFAVLPAPHLVTPHPWLVLAMLTWGAGTLAITLFWLTRAWRLSAIVRRAGRIPLQAPVPVKTTPALLEPGLVGIFRPVILVPDRLAERLSHTEINAILAHELCHLRRRDNLLAAIHMLVEAIFWFHPLVWFIGARLVDEREQACDEAVLGAGQKPLDYARAILKVCRLYLRSPLACAAGVSGADLDRRITAIMATRDADEVAPQKILLLAGLSLFAILTPFVTGGLKPAAAPQLVQRFTQLLAPSAGIAPAVRPQGRHKILAHSAAARRPRDYALAAPAIDASQPIIIVPLPQIASEPQPIEETTAAASDARVCRPPQQLAGSRLLGPEVCLPKQEWDRLKAQGLQLLPDGKSVAALHDNSRVSVPYYCSAPRTGTATITAVLGTMNPSC